ncbi:hypothetical protein HYV72_01885 [Candidatus Uhrbacteria bacterium]|nr:hypothetical protein [Candidatus Uhrbacteria bacterium]
MRKSTTQKPRAKLKQREQLERLVAKEAKRVAREYKDVFQRLEEYDRT